MSWMRNAASWSAIATIVFLSIPARLLADSRPEDKIRAGTEVFRELLNAPDKEVPEALLERCRCIAVIPDVLKAAIGYGVRRGEGILTCRDTSGTDTTNTWSPVSFVNMTGGSIGFQLGAQKSDIVLFFVTDKSVRSLLESKFTLGANAGVAAGPLGRSAEASTDIKLDAEIYSYAKSKGLFAGVSVEGARLAPDRKENQRYYGRDVPPDSLLFAHQAPRTSPEELEFRKALPR